MNQNSNEHNQEAGKEERMKEVHHYHYRRWEGFSPGKIFLGLAVVFVGLIFLAKNTGFLPVDLNIYWWNLWPVVLIFIGLSMVSFRGFLGAIFSLLIALLALAAILFLLLGPTNLIKGGDFGPVKFENFRMNCWR